MPLPRPLRDAVLPKVSERLSVDQRRRAQDILGRIVHDAEELAGMGEERGGVLGMTMVGFATAIRDRAKLLLEVVD